MKTISDGEGGRRCLSCSGQEIKLAQIVDLSLYRFGFLSFYFMDTLAPTKNQRWMLFLPHARIIRNIVVSILIAGCYNKILLQLWGLVCIETLYLLFIAFSRLNANRLDRYSDIGIQALILLFIILKLSSENPSMTEFTRQMKVGKAMGIFLAMIILGAMIVAVINILSMIALLVKEYVLKRKHKVGMSIQFSPVNSHSPNRKQEVAKPSQKYPPNSSMLSLNKLNESPIKSITGNVPSPEHKTRSSVGIKQNLNLSQRDNLSGRSTGRQQIFSSKQIGGVGGLTAGQEITLSIKSTVKVISSTNIKAVLGPSRNRLSTGALNPAMTSHLHQLSSPSIQTQPHPRSQAAKQG